MRNSQDCGSDDFPSLRLPDDLQAWQLPERHLWILDYLWYREGLDELEPLCLSAFLRHNGQPDQQLADRFRGALLGLAIGDAVGTTNEFSERDRYIPLTDMVGGGPFGLSPGQWTDDTSMAYALGQSLIERECFDASDQMNKYLAWYRRGAFSSNGQCFDIGTTVRQALERYECSGDPFAGSRDPLTAGNGSLMRLAPVVLFYYHNPEQLLLYAGESSRVTHAAPEAVISCQYYAWLIYLALSGVDKQALLGSRAILPAELVAQLKIVPAVANIAAGCFLGKPRQAILSSGYVCHSLEAALWCFAETDSFREGVLLAANLGDDSDTVAAIYGQLAGAFYGEQRMPTPWLSRLSYQYVFYLQADALVRRQIARDHCADGDAEPC